MPRSILPLLLLASFALSGCAASIAAGAIGAAIRSGQERPDPNADLGPAARQACQTEASKHGEVRIIDVERRSAGKVIVWGTVEGAGGRRSFECGYNGRIAGFKVREIKRAR